MKKLLKDTVIIDGNEITNVRFVSRKWQSRSVGFAGNVLHEQKFKDFIMLDKINTPKFDWVFNNVHEGSLIEIKGDGEWNDKNTRRVSTDYRPKAESLHHITLTLD